MIFNIFFLNKFFNSYFLIFQYHDVEIENNKDESKSIIDLNQRVEDLENIIEKLRNENNYNQMINIQDNILNNNDENGMKDALMNTMNELREKEQIIENLKNQLKQTLSNQKMSFDDKEIVSSMSQKLKEKDSMIQNLQKQIHGEDYQIKNKYEEILKSKNDFLSSNEK